MERLLQYLDELDDLAGAMALIAERMRDAARTAAVVLLSIAFQVSGIMLALSKPPLALAAVALLTAAVLHRAALRQPPYRALQATP
ncbi:MAG: hypothetical protein WD448_10730 [Woeseia sp.]